jgi:hypothetical protein
MIQADIDHITPNENNNFSLLSSEPQPISWTHSSFTPIQIIDKSHIINDSTFDSDTHNSSTSIYNNNTEDENIDWEFVTKQLETVRLKINEQINKKISFLFNRNYKLQQIFFYHNRMKVIMQDYHLKYQRNIDFVQYQIIDLQVLMRIRK